MKRLLCISAMLLIVTMVPAQSLLTTNPKNYSGKMYVKGMDILSTPRYISFSDHAIISKSMPVPVVKLITVTFNFEKNIFIMDTDTVHFTFDGIQKYKDSLEDHVVLSFHSNKKEADKDRYELVWPEFNSPYLLEITKGEDGFELCKMILSHDKPELSPGDAIQQLLEGLMGL